MVYRKLGCFCKGLRKRLRVTRRTNKQVALWSESRVNWIDARSDFQRRSSVERKVGVSWASFFKGWSVQCRAEGRDEAPSPWNSELRWPLWERILCRGNVFTNWSTTGPGEGSQESEQVVSRARLVRKIVSAGFAMAAPPSWDLVQEYFPRCILAPGNSHRRPGHS